MKKVFQFSLGVLAAFASLFVSCSDNNSDSDKNDSLICQISVSNTNGGSAKITNYIGSSANVLIGNGVEVVATPDVGYKFIGWYLGNSDVLASTDAVYTFTASKNISLLAKFEKTFMVSVQSAGNGSVAIKDISDKSLELLIGSEIIVVATPDADYGFLGWYVGDAETPVSTDATYTFTVKEGVALVAKFSKWPLVSISSGGNGTVSFENSSKLSQYVQSGSELTVIATPAANCDFFGWFIGDSNEPISTELTYTFTVNESISLVAKFEGRKTYIDGYEYVDLGLPSGRKWAAYNVGATKPEEYGGYYAWGETEEKSNYSWSTYKWCNGSYNTMTKYCTDSSYGTVDNKTVLDPEDDVAHVKWGGSWRMPTKAEQDELRNKCSWQWTTLNGVNGYRVTGPNGNSIFLPAAGYRLDTSLYLGGSFGNYWSSTPLESLSYSACCLYFLGTNFDWNSYNRYYGLSVRPVSE